jgi:hypothetical protein
VGVSVRELVKKHLRIASCASIVEIPIAGWV